MDGFSQKRGELYCEGVSVESLARKHGTPLYIYSRAALEARLGELQQAFRAANPLICYSVKANSNLSILRLLAKAGAGFDIVSGGELFRALKAGADPAKIVFAGVGKRPDEIGAALRAGIRMFNAESEAEIAAADAVARGMGRTAVMALRVNPDVDARTHAKTTTGRKDNKFGIALPHARRIFAERARYPNVELSGIHLHLGSPIYTTTPYAEALAKMEGFVAEVRAMGAELKTLNMGGGYCVAYEGQKVIRPRDYARVIVPAAKRLGLQLIIEPGRFVAANSAALLARVVYVKEGWNRRRFVILDAAMNDLVRPAMYGSHHHIWPARGPASPLVAAGGGKGRLETVDIVGPICETSDCFAKDRALPPVKAGELMVIFSAGAYGMAMSSSYNSRPRAAEALVDGTRARIIRKRETYEDLVRGE
jgi:diaminopimelate decarboxylase